MNINRRDLIKLAISSLALAPIGDKLEKIQPQQTTTKTEEYLKTIHDERAVCLPQGLIVFSGLTEAQWEDTYQQIIELAARPVDYNWIMAINLPPGASVEFIPFSFSPDPRTEYIKELWESFQTGACWNG